MSCLVEGEALFAENGYLIRRDVLRPDQIQQAVDALWHYIDAEPSLNMRHPGGIVERDDASFDLMACIWHGIASPLSAPISLGTDPVPAR